MIPARLVPRLEILAAAFLFSTGGAAIKACSLSSWQVASFRSAVAALVVLAIMPAGRRGWSARSFAVGAAYAATMVLFVLSNKLTTAANSIFLQYTAPLYLVALSPWLLGERLRARDLVVLAVMAIGLAMFFLDAAPAVATAPRPTLGNLLAVLSGVGWAFTALGLRWMARPGGGASPVETSVVCGNLFAFLVCVPQALPIETASAGDWAIVFYLGTFQIAGAYFFLVRGLKHVPVLEASLLLLLEPVLNPLWAWIVHGEQPGAFALAGGGIVLGATVVKTWNDSRESGGVVSPSP